MAKKPQIVSDNEANTAPPAAPPTAAPVAPPAAPIPAPAAPAFPAFPAPPSASQSVLSAGVTARATGVAAFAPYDQLAPLVNDTRGPLVEVNTQATDGQGGYAYRATELGVAVASGTAFPIQPPAAPAAAYTPRKQIVIPETALEIETDVPLPAIRRRGREASPLTDKIDGLPLNGAVFVEKTAEVPDPQTAAMNACSSANKRWKDDNGNALRRFVVRGVNDLFPIGHPRAGQARIGSRVHRIA